MKREEKIKMALSLANKGLTKKEISERLNISVRTLERYQKNNSELATKIKENEKDLSQLIKIAFKVAKGYKNKTNKVLKTKDGIEVVEVEESIPPSPDMIKYLLNNRDRINFSNNPNKDKLDRELLELKKKEIENKTIL